MAWNPFRRRTTGNAANPPNQNPTNNQNSSQNQQDRQEARGRGNSPFYMPSININIGGKNYWWWALFVLIIVGILWYLNKYHYGRLVIGVSYVVLVFLIIFTLYGIITAFKQGDVTKGFVSWALLIWLLDMTPPDFWILGGFLGPSYSGFEISIGALLSINWVPIVLSSIVFAGMYVNMIFRIIEKEYVGFLLAFIFIIVSNNILARIFPGYLDLRVRIHLPDWGGIEFILYYIFLIGICTLLFYLLYRFGTRYAPQQVSSLASYLFMLIVFSFFWINNGWVGNIRAVHHAVFIVIFGLFYIRPHEQNNPVAWHLLIPLFLIIDFFGYGLLWDTEYLWAKFIPLFLIFTVTYCYVKTESKYAMVTFIVIITIILVLSLQATAYASSGTIEFKPRQGEDFTSFFNTFVSRTRELIENRLDVATAGLYRGNVEKNQYESLGVYFGNVRAADPVFFEDEPITVWGTIRSKTYSDAVIINFSCYRWKDNTKISADKVFPDIHFPIFTLEEVDTECTFYPKLDEDDMIKPGPNTVTLAAAYNFGTDAYLKSYFIDRDRFRASTRENIDPLVQYGIKDKNPVAVFTNGPVEIGMGTGQPLITVTDGYLIKPSIDITLRNREQIHDKDKNIITKWDGRIKNITELILLVPPGIELSNLDNCGKEDATDLEKADCPCNVPFAEYTDEHCKKSCESSVDECRKACIDSYGKGAASACDKPGCGQCVKECEITLSKCRNECDFMFSASEPEEPSLQGDYKGYRLIVNSKEFKEYNKDIEKARSFRCRFTPTTAVLDDTPITTRYFRVRVKYNYIVENSVQINVQPSSIKGGGINTQEILLKTSIDEIGKQLDQESVNAGFNPNLIMAIAHVESGIRHCCQKGYGGAGTKCTPSEERDCDPPRTITSGTSVGLMQVRYDKPEIRAEVDTRVSNVCEEGQDIFDLECNIKVGISILKGKSNIYKDGCKESAIYKTNDRSKYKTFFDACDNGVTGTGVRYDSYKGIDAAIRAYNGWGRTANYDVNYVEKVRRAEEKIKNGQIVDALGIRQYFASRSGYGMELKEEDSVAPSVRTGDIELTSALHGSYDAQLNKVTITWKKSAKTGVVKYEIERQANSQSTILVQNCNLAEDGSPQKQCIDDKIPVRGLTYFYTLRVLDNAGARLEENTAQVIVTA